MKIPKKSRNLVLCIFLTVSILLSGSAIIGTNSAKMAYLPYLLQATIKPLSHSEVARGEWFVEDTGTCFEITASSYLNIILSSSNLVHIHLESIPKLVSFIIENKSSATSTLISLSGFTPLTTYFRYQEDKFIETFTTDSNGEYTYSQDISQPHHVYFKEHPSTLYISSDYTFTGDIHEPIYVMADNIVIDGKGYMLENSASYGFYLYNRKNVTIKNVIIKGWLYGIMLYASSGNTIFGNNITEIQYYGISAPYSKNNLITENYITETNWFGITFSRSEKNIIAENHIINNRFGIRAINSLNNSIFENNFIENYFMGIELSFSTNNLIYHNNFINNTNQVQDRNPMENNWYHPELLEGNYWSNYPGVDDGSGIDKHSIPDDGIGDTNLSWPNSDFDNYPFMEKDGWKKPDNEKFEGFGMLIIGWRIFYGDASLSLSKDLIRIEIRDQSASWNIIEQCDGTCFEFYYGQGDLGKIFLFIYRNDISYVFAMGRKVLFCGKT